MDKAQRHMSKTYVHDSRDDEDTSQRDMECYYDDPEASANGLRVPEVAQLLVALYSLSAQLFSVLVVYSYQIIIDSLWDGISSDPRLHIKFLDKEVRF